VIIAAISTSKEEHENGGIAMPQLLTDWLSIGTGGPTANGRNIKPEWLNQTAAAYDPEEYTAVINVAHRYGNLGTVRELRTTKDAKARTVLQARIRPNKYYLYNLDEESGIFFSMEITHDFAKSGKPYLTGLASTDKPASLGTTEARFSAEPGNVELSDPLEIDRSAFQFEAGHNGIVAAVVSAVKDVFFFNHKKESDEMTEEQIKTMLEAAVKPLNDAVTKLTGDLSAFTSKLGKTTDDEESEKSKTNVKSEQPDTFNATAFAAQLKPMFDKIEGAVTGVSTKLEAALKGTGKEIPAGTGGNDTPDFV